MQRQGVLARVTGCALLVNAGCDVPADSTEAPFEEIGIVRLAHGAEAGCATQVTGGDINIGKAIIAPIHGAIPIEVFTSIGIDIIPRAALSSGSLSSTNGT